MISQIEVVAPFYSYSRQTDCEVMQDIGSGGMALAQVEKEYEKYRMQRDKEYQSDFDQELAKSMKVL